MDPCDYIGQNRVTRTRHKDFKFKIGDQVWWREERRIGDGFERTGRLIETHVHNRDHRNSGSHAAIYDIPVCHAYWVQETDLVDAEEYAASVLTT